MTASADILPAHPEGDDLFCLDALVEPSHDAGGGLPARRERQDGWTPARQRLFLQMLAEGHTVTHACAALGMSTSSAYVLRRAAAGSAFALGWQAAQLLAREHLADKLLERAVHGVCETVTRPDGSTLTRQRHDNRLAMHMLTRLDRLADGGAGPAEHAAARLVAGEFDQFLALVERGGGGARAGLFLARRLGDDRGAASDDLAPVRALARADAWLRGRADAAADVAVADLDPAQRAGWTAEQWARAEAAGLLVLAPPAPADDADERELWQLDDGDTPDADNPDGDPVWWDGDRGTWRTSFPPRDDFYGAEDGAYGDPHYARDLSPEEREVLEGPLRAAREARRAVAAAERDAYFADGVDVVDVDACGVPIWGVPEAVASSAPAGTEAAAPALAAPAEAPVSRSGRTRGASRRQRRRDAPLPGSDPSGAAAPVRGRRADRIVAGPFTRAGPGGPGGSEVSP